MELPRDKDEVKQAEACLHRIEEEEELMHQVGRGRGRGESV